MSVSPCFRKGDVGDWHFETFMKLELYDNTGRKNALNSMIEGAVSFFNFFCGECEVVDTPDGKDINVGGIEVGSYGVRTFRDKTWVYGTGVALPRITQVKKLMQARGIASVKVYRMP